MTMPARNYASLFEEWKLPAALFLLSFATVAFTIALFRLLGATRLLGIPFLLVALAMLLLAPGPRMQRLLLLQQVIVIALLAVPQLETGFLQLYKSNSFESTHAYGERDYETIYQKLLLVFALLLLMLVRRRGNPGIPGRSFTQLLLVSLFVGANFLVIEHYLMLALFRKLYVYHDALVLGAISFLILSGLGSTFITPRLRPLLQVTGGFFILLLLLYHDSLSPWGSIALLAPVAFVTGSFFPALFEAAAENPLAVFAADSIGAAIGSLASFFIPIVFGFEWFFVTATILFWATAFATYLFFRRLPAFPHRQRHPRPEDGDGGAPQHDFRVSRIRYACTSALALVPCRRRW
jgi:hypothetical protein